MAADLLTHRGGRGEPVVLVHGLMGRGTTWSRQLPWLTQLGAVYTYDAPWHRGRGTSPIPCPISTERFVADLGDAVAALDAPVRLVGHSMGALHSWCLAAERPELVSALVVEDMAPDFRGRTTGPWEPWLHNLPVEFDSAEKVFAEFGRTRGPVLLGGIRPDCDRVAAARIHVEVDRDRGRVGHPRLLGAMAGGALSSAARRGR
jgi:pimeloyl-ACP methyl ester carboxylesterase